MLEIEQNGNVVKIDVRERILRGEHPRYEIIDFVKNAQRGTVVEIHLPHKAPPLVAGLKAIGVNAVVNEVGPDHYRIMCVVF